MLGDVILYVYVSVRVTEGRREGSYEGRCKQNRKKSIIDDEAIRREFCFIQWPGNSNTSEWWSKHACWETNMGSNVTHLHNNKWSTKGEEEKKK